MAALLAFERGRAREQKCPAFVAARIHEAPGGIPNLGHLLPFIDQVWRIADERQAFGSTSAAARCAGSSSLETLAERESAVQVLPHHLGPLISTQPNARIRVSRRSSMSRGLYPFWVNLFGVSIDGRPSLSRDMRNYAILNADFTLLSM
mgnify:CR=1 FL=1